MLYFLSQWILESARGAGWESSVSWLRLFRYITVRSAGAAVTALVLCLWLGPRMIAWLKSLKCSQDYADKAEEKGDLTARVLSKKGTPTMGGLMIILALDLTALLWTRLNPLVVLTLLSVVVLAGLGFMDDWAKITRQTSEGVTERVKLIVQCVLALFIGVYLWRSPATTSLVTDIMVPFVKAPVASCAILCGYRHHRPGHRIGSSNAVNLTDGLDGLAASARWPLSASPSLYWPWSSAYLAGNVKAAEFPSTCPYVPGVRPDGRTGCASLVGCVSRLSLV